MDRTAVSYFTVSGTDPTWVNGITKRIENMFEKHKTKNDLFHYSPVPAVLACIPIVVGVFAITFEPLKNTILSIMMAGALGGLIPFFGFGFFSNGYFL